MPDKVKQPSDGKLIQKIFGLIALDWARYPDDSLVFISHTGQKFSYSRTEIEQKLEELRPSPPVKTPAPKKPDPKPKPKTDPKSKAAGGAAAK